MAVLYLGGQEVPAERDLVGIPLNAGDRTVSVAGYEPAFTYGNPVGVRKEGEALAVNGR